MLLAVKKLREWLIGKRESSGLTQAKFAKELGCSGAYISQILKNKRVPSGSFGVKILRATEGEIDLIDWYQEVKDD